ncbi:MAG: hypothetical protein QNJ16_21365 [Rhodobacter sp.]|nr:hypothetical protein [Rhodobacter sp.]
MTKALAAKRSGLQLDSFESMQRFASACYAAGTLGTRNSREKAIAVAVVQMQYGAELGMGPMESLSSISVIGGRPVLNSAAIAARIKASGKYDFTVDEFNSEKCELTVINNDGQVLGSSTFSLDDAKTAGLLGGNQNWKKYPRNMLFARCVTNAARLYCADVFIGAVYSEEEMKDLELEEMHQGVAPDVGHEAATSDEAAEGASDTEGSGAPPDVEYPWGEGKPSKRQWERVLEYAEEPRLLTELRDRCIKASKLNPAEMSSRHVGALKALIGECKEALSEREPGEEG